jgi:diguanylate cyclase (GGDEF)-like protein
MRLMPGEPSRASRRLMAYSVAAMYGGAAALAVLQTLIPGGPAFSVLPGLAAVAVVLPLLAVGPKLPLPVLAALSPLGVALIGLSLATTEGPGDGAVLYVWPALWTAFFFGRAGAILIVAWIAVVHAAVLLSLAAGEGSLDRWLDVVVTMGIVAAVVQALSRRNQQLVRSLTAEARIDKLTGLLNRRGFEERAEVELLRAQRQEEALAAVALDVDHFKQVNDEYGHEAGDRVLARVGEILRAELRGTDLIARMGGEEYVALLPATGLDEACAVAERARIACSAAASDGLPAVTLSAGVAAETAPDRIGPLLREADAALYAAKVDGRDRTSAAPGSGSSRNELEGRTSSVSLLHPEGARSGVGP